MNKEEKYDMLPCPFCGGQAKFLLYMDFIDIGCETDDCIMYSGSDIQYEDADKAVKEWNRRDA